MPGALVDQSSIFTCPHGGQVTSISTNPRVTINGVPVATMNDQFLVAGCVFAVGPKPQPCVKVQWLMPATRITVMGAPVILSPEPGICQSAEMIPQGAPIPVFVQPRVKGM
jgi:hypothetical protein